jgi:hypothetical protein
VINAEDAYGGGDSSQLALSSPVQGAAGAGSPISLWARWMARAGGAEPSIGSHGVVGQAGESVRELLGSLPRLCGLGQDIGRALPRAISRSALTRLVNAVAALRAARRLK